MDRHHMTMNDTESYKILKTNNRSKHHKTIKNLSLKIIKLYKSKN